MQAAEALSSSTEQVLCVGSTCLPIYADLNEGFKTFLSGRLVVRGKHELKSMICEGVQHQMHAVHP